VPFVGPSGRLAAEAFRKAGLDFRKDCWITNALICRPPRNQIGDQRRIDYCRPNLLKVLDDLEPEKVVLLGNTAVKSLIGHLWDPDTKELNRWLGWQIPSQKVNAWVCPTYHPSYLLRNERNPVLGLLFVRHLEAVARLEGRPWKEVPDYASQVDLVYNPAEAARVLDRMREKGGLIAFDYETDRLKPDKKDSTIVCCSVCWRGRKTIAFPWKGEATRAMKDLLASPSCHFIASNMKFEDRWSRRFGMRVRNWFWDTMLAAHALDNRKGITSIKFQSFVLLGQALWNKHLERALRTPKDKDDKSCNAENRIRAGVSWDDLLLYCGLDSLLEYLVARIQMRQAGEEVPG
jgi:uracil-DNA glycosylase family 4